ncbi:MAG: radical SAM protein [Sulfolobales archaeon]
MKERSGIGPLLAALRLVLGSKSVRLLLRAGVRESRCVYSESEIRENTMLYHALSRFAGEAISCPMSTSVTVVLIDLLMRIGIRIMRGDIESVREALRDPALRRGVSLVFEGIARYGVTVPQRLPAPFLIVWNFTNMCNLRCLHCYQRADKPLPDELTLEEKLRLVAELDEAGVAAIALSGGEPTIHSHFLTVVREISRRGIYAAVATNGWMFADIDFLKRSVEAGLRYVEISIDSANPSKHDRFRGVSGSWSRAVKALENVVKLKIDHAMATTVTKYNIDEIDEILDLAESIGVRRVVFFNFIPVGRGYDNMYLDLDPVEREYFLRKIYSEMKRRKIEIVSTAPQYGRVVLQMSSNREIAPTHFYVGGDPIVRSVAEFVGGCGAGRIYAGIQPNGDVIPCVFLPIRVGSVREKSFRDIWENSPVLRALRDRDDLGGFCGRCPYKNLCGGCRARAYAYFRDLKAPDPGCLYNLRFWRDLQRSSLQNYRDRVRFITSK